MLETSLGILSAALSAAALISQLTKKVLISFFLSLLVLTSLAIAVQSYVHERKVRDVQSEIVKLVTPRVHSVDDLYQELSPTELPLIAEALSRCVSEGTLEQTVLELQMNDGSFIKVRGYYRP